MNILFLDFDGVLNSSIGFERDKPRTAFYFAPECVENLKTVLDALPELKIVVSSAWRECASMSKLRRIFRKYGLPGGRIVGITPTALSDYMRGHEIQSWLDSQPPGRVERFIILDDDSDMADLMPYLVQTKDETGFTRKNAEEVICRLSPRLRLGRSWRPKRRGAGTVPIPGMNL